MRASILDRYVIGREICLHGFGGIAVSYISEIHFEILAAGDTTECRLGMVFVTWCIVNLDCYVTLYSACIILIIDNDISHLGRNMIYWIWGVCDVTMISDFSDHI